MDPNGNSGGSGALLIHSGHASEFTSGQISSDVLDLGGGSLQPQTIPAAPYVSRGTATLRMNSPIEGVNGGMVQIEATDNLDGTAFSTWDAAENTNGTSVAKTYASNGSGAGGDFTAMEVRGSGLHVDANTKNLDFTESSGLVVDTDAAVAGVFAAGNIAFGSISIQPTAANTPTSAMVSGLKLRGSTFRAYVTANSGVSGTGMLGVSVTGVSSAGVTVWPTRDGTNTTTIYWMVVGS